MLRIASAPLRKEYAPWLVKSCLLSPPPQFSLRHWSRPTPRLSVAIGIGAAVTIATFAPIAGISSAIAGMCARIGAILRTTAPISRDLRYGASRADIARDWADIRRDRRDLRGDFRDIRRDRRDLRWDRWDRFDY
jgi:hypothetical protein